jgi:hypothetical protein
MEALANIPEAVKGWLYDLVRIMMLLQQLLWALDLVCGSVAQSWITDFKPVSDWVKMI